MRADVAPAFLVPVHGEHLEREDVPRPARHDARVGDAGLLLQFAQRHLFQVALSVGVPAIQLHDPYVLWNTMSVLVAVGSTVQIEHVICASESRWKTRGSASSCRRITSRSDASCWLKGW